jgi:putative colanic acid biosynthesis acetyltransferase WcaF
LCAASHDYTQPDFPIYAKKVCIGAQAWLATDVFVAPGVTIGEGAVVGARSSVFHDLPPMMVFVGSPAKAIKPRASVAASLDSTQPDFPICDKNVCLGASSFTSSACSFED